jgi:hypothetical protein
MLLQAGAAVIAAGAGPAAYARRLVAPAKVHLPIDQVSALIEQDFVDRQYFITVKGGALLLHLRPLRMSPCIVYIADDTGTHVRQPSPEPPCFTQ